MVRLPTAVQAPTTSLGGFMGPKVGKSIVPALGSVPGVSLGLGEPPRPA